MPIPLGKQTLIATRSSELYLSQSFCIMLQPGKTDRLYMFTYVQFLFLETMFFPGYKYLPCVAGRFENIGLKKE